MNDETRKPVLDELMKTVSALQDAFAYCSHAESFAIELNLKAERMRIDGLKKRILAAIDHAGILHQAVRRD